VAVAFLVVVVADLAEVLEAVELIMLAAEEVLEDMERGCLLYGERTGAVKFVAAGAKVATTPT